LSVISRSPAKLQPVLRSIATIAARLCDSIDAQVYQLIDGKLRMVSQHGALPRLEAHYQLPLTRGSVTGRAILDCRTVHVDDIAALLESEYPDAKPSQLVVGHRTTLATPMLREGEPVGAILLRRNEVRPFSPKQIALLQTFADQAVIAIENTRLFEEVQARTQELTERTQELTETLRYQTATSNVLGVISRSKFHLQPVLDSIVETAAKLCGADKASIRRVEGGMLHHVADYGYTPEQRAYFEACPVEPGSTTMTARVALELRTVHVPDVLADAEHERPDFVKTNDTRSGVAVPLLRDRELVGVLVLLRIAQRAFTDKQIELLETFADQAVIAIENTRLFEAEQTSKRELQESLEYQTATSDVLGVISQSPSNLQPVLDAIVGTAARLCQADWADFRLLRDGLYHIAATTAREAIHVRITRHRPVAAGRGSVAGRAALEQRTVHIPDIQADPEYTYTPGPAPGFAGRTSLGVPLLRNGVVIGVIVMFKSGLSPFTQKQIDLVTTFASQAVIAINNVDLFEEVQARTSELAKTVEDLEIASQHKSQFVANMSHELRTPLAAMLGYAELLQEGIYGAQPEKSLPILTRIRSNGKHLLGLINTVLDISKIEAGQFKLNIGEYALGSIVDTVMVATESLAAAKKLAFKAEVAKGLPYGLGDEQRLTQVLLNLVGNAIKFTDAGEVRIAASASNSYFTVSVSDTGLGIPPEECDRIFEKFRQVDSSNTRTKGGTGLGLTIAKEIVEMHGGRIWAESTLGRGSTFRMELPVRAATANGAA
jgi:signal transduction histidine kinase